MSFETTSNKVIYVGNNTASIFSVPFLFQNKSDLIVQITDDTTVYDLALDTDYIVRGENEISGGSIELVDLNQAWMSLTDFLNTGYKILIRRSPEIVQSTSFRNAGSFLAETHEDAFDRQTFFTQDLEEKINRSLHFGEFSQGLEGKLPTPVDGKFLRWEGVAGELVNSDFEVDDLITDAMVSTLADANAYTDVEIALLGSDLTTYIDNGDTATLSDANNYTDAGLSGKANTVHTHNLSDLNQSGALDGQIIVWNDIAGSWIPGTGGGGGGAVASVNGQVGVVVLAKTDVGLANVDNTADTAKPVSTAQQTALDLKANIASPTFTGTVTLPAGQVVNGVTLTNAGGTTNFLRADGTYAAPASGGLTQPEVLSRLTFRI